MLSLWLREWWGVRGSWKEAVHHTQRRRIDISPPTRPRPRLTPASLKGSESHKPHTEGGAPTVAFSEFIEDDVKKLFRCFVMCGRVINTRLSHREESAVGVRRGMRRTLPPLNLRTPFYRHVKRHAQTYRASTQPPRVRAPRDDRSPLASTTRSACPVSLTGWWRVCLNAIQMPGKPSLVT